MRIPGALCRVLQRPPNSLSLEFLGGVSSELGEASLYDEIETHKEYGMCSHPSLAGSVYPLGGLLQALCVKTLKGAMPVMLININSAVRDCGAVPWSQVCSGFLPGSDWPWQALDALLPWQSLSPWLLALPIGWRSVAQLLTGWCARFPFSGSRIFLSLPRVIPVLAGFYPPSSFFHPTILPSFPKTSLSVANFAKCLPMQKCLTLKSRAGLASKASYGRSLVQPCTQIPKASSSSLLPRTAIVKMSRRPLECGF